jgi:valacyclovir hydrolase
VAESDFAAQIAEFARDHRVIAPDRRGYGHSRPPARTFPDDFYARDARDMAEFCDRLGLRASLVLGWSEGAAVAAWLAALRPAQVAGLVIWGGIAEVGDDDIAIFGARRDVSTSPPRAVAAMNAFYGEDYWPACWGAWIDVMQRLHRRGGDACLAPLEQLACASLVLHAADDNLIRAEHPRRLHARLARSEFHEFARGGHYVHVAQATTFNARVRDFVASKIAPWAAESTLEIGT